MVAIESVHIIEVHYGEHINQRRQKVSTIEAREGICQRLEGDQRPSQAQPIRSSPAQFLHSLINILINHLVNHSFFESVNFWVLLLELIPLYRLFLYEVKSQPNIALSLRLEVQKSVRSLELVQVALNVVVVVNVFLELGSPLSALLLIHEILTVHVVEVDSYLCPVWIALATARHVLLVHVEVEPQVLHLNRQIIHILPQFTQADVCHNVLPQRL